MYVCFGFWWWACLPLPEKGRWVGRRVRRVNLERALSRSSAPRVCPDECPLGSGLEEGGGHCQGGFLDWGILCALARFNPEPLQFSAELPPPAFFLFFFAFRHLDLHPL